MRKHYINIAFFIVQFLFAQVPAGYYDAATASGFALKTQLKTIISNGHIDRSYGSGTNQTNNGLWGAYGTTDRDNGIGYENDNTIVDIYSENPATIDPYNFNFNTALTGRAGQCGSGGLNIEGDCYNREHIVPQSYFGGSNAPAQYQIMRNDVQQVYPTDKRVNAIRDDYAFGPVNIASITTLNGSKLGTASNSGYSAGFTGTVFEPINEFKGDIARVFFYFATRYEDSMDDLFAAYTNVDCRVMFDGTTSKVFSNTFLNILLTWDAQDPVSTKETLRNNASYLHQGNRNPYIDNNNYVYMIWGQVLNVANYDVFKEVTIYPNPILDGIINIKTDMIIDNIELLNINGQLIRVVNKPLLIDNNIKIENLSKGFYFLKLSALNQSIVKKILVN
jgi:endonuclease I